MCPGTETGALDLASARVASPISQVIQASELVDAALIFPSNGCENHCKIIDDSTPVSLPSPRCRMASNPGHPEPALSRSAPGSGGADEAKRRQICSKSRVLDQLNV